MRRDDLRTIWRNDEIVRPFVACANRRIPYYHILLSPASFVATVPQQQFVC